VDHNHAGVDDAGDRTGDDADEVNGVNETGGRQVADLNRGPDVVKDCD